MKTRFATSAVLLVIWAGFWPVFAQENIRVTASSSEAANGLDLTAVGQLFKTSANLEAFERALNDPDAGVNNLDLDGNGQIDFIRVVEETDAGVHLVILQVPFADNDFQDVATIEVENTGEDVYNMQVHGNDLIYGRDYYVTFHDTRIRSWPIIAMIYRPVYRPYRSVFHFGFYPRWWRSRVPLAVPAYRARTVRIVERNAFTVGNHPWVIGADRIHYIPRSSLHFQQRAHAFRRERETEPVNGKGDHSAGKKYERPNEANHNSGSRERPERRH
jgi:hypothetical protein